MAKQILNAVPERLYETAIPVYTYHFVVLVPRGEDEPPDPDPLDGDEPPEETGADHGGGGGG
jgi:hypothetical protein